jgi:hypothetical protein
MQSSSYCGLLDYDPCIVTGGHKVLGGKYCLRPEVLPRRWRQYVLPKRFYPLIGRPKSEEFCISTLMLEAAFSPETLCPSTIAHDVRTKNTKIRQWKPQNV